MSDLKTCKELYCDNCINRKIAELRRIKAKEQKEAELESEKKQLEEDLYSSPKKVIPIDNPHQDLLQARLQYRKELQDQIRAKQLREAKEAEAEKQRDLEYLQRVQEEMQSSMSSLKADLQVQKLSLKQELDRQVREKQSIKKQQEYERQLDKVELEDDLMRQRESQKESTRQAKVQSSELRSALQSQMNWKSQNSLEQNPEFTNSEFDYKTCGSCNTAMDPYYLSYFDCSDW